VKRYSTWNEMGIKKMAKLNGFTVRGMKSGV